MNKIWSDSELQLIRENAPTMKDEELAKLLENTRFIHFSCNASKHNKTQF